MKLQEAQEILNGHVKEINKKLRPQYRPESQAISRFAPLYEQRDTLRAIMNVASCVDVNKKEELTLELVAHKMQLGCMAIISDCEETIKILDSFCKKKR